MHASFLIDSPPSKLFIRIKNPYRLNAMINRIKRKSTLKLVSFFNHDHFKTKLRFSNSMIDQSLSLKPDWSLKPPFTQGE
jgi:hypothetical protein